MPRTEDAQYSRIVTLAGIALVIGVLYFLQDVLLPFALAVLLGFLLTPLVMRLQHWVAHRIAASVLALLLAFTIFAGIVWVVADQMVALATKLPTYQDTLVERIRSVRSMVKGEGSSKLTETVQEIQEEIAGDDAELTEGGSRTDRPRMAIPVRVVETEVEQSPLETLLAWLRPLGKPLGMAAVVTIFTLFILIQREDLRDRLIRLAGTRQMHVTTQALDEAAGRVSRYLLMQLIINASYGAILAAGLLIIGLPNALLWGLLAAVLRFLPYVGPWVAAVLPIVLSLAVFEGWPRPLATIGLFVGLELFSNNVMEPWLYGSSAGVSVLGIILAATFWTWLWGPIGLVLSTPLTVCLVVLGRYVPHLHFLNVLLSDQPPLQVGVRYYQRLLALDDHEADDLTSAYLQTHSVHEFYEQLLIPVLSLSERDRSEGNLSTRQVRFIHRITRDVVDELGQREIADAAEGAVADEVAAETTGVEPQPPEKPALRMVCLPAEDVADRIAGRMVAQLLEARGHEAEAVPLRVTHGEVHQLVAHKNAQCVIISALAPGGAIAAREGCHLLRRHFPQLKIVVGLWNATGPLTKTTERLTRAGADLVGTSLAEVLDQIQDYVEPAATAH